MRELQSEMEFFDEPDPVASASSLRNIPCSIGVATSGAGVFPTTNMTKVTNELGVVTTIILSSYQDRHFLLITQTGKFGSMLTSWSEDRLDGSSKLYKSHVLLGKRDDELLNVFAKEIMQIISPRSTLPLLLSIALDDENGRNAETFKTILESVRAIF